MTTGEARGEVQSPRSKVQSLQSRPGTLDLGLWTTVSRPDPLFHLVLLALSASVLMLAGLLSIRSGTQVLLPLIDMPLP